MRHVWETKAAPKKRDDVRPVVRRPSALDSSFDEYSSGGEFETDKRHCWNTTVQTPIWLLRLADSAGFADAMMRCDSFVTTACVLIHHHISEGSRRNY